MTLCSHHHDHRNEHGTERTPVTHTATTLLGTSLLMPRSPRHNRVLAECLFRLPSGLGN
jgi:hypothetical protein